MVIGGIILPVTGGIIVQMLRTDTEIERHFSTLVRFRRVFT